MQLYALVVVARCLLRLGCHFVVTMGKDFYNQRQNFWNDMGDRHMNVGNVILHTVLNNDMMISPTIQKNIVDAYDKETIKVVIKDLDGDYFRILIDKPKDISRKEQITLDVDMLTKIEW